MAPASGPPPPEPRKGEVAEMRTALRALKGSGKVRARLRRGMRRDPPACSLLPSFPFPPSGVLSLQLLMKGVPTSWLLDWFLQGGRVFSPSLAVCCHSVSCVRGGRTEHA